jgi:hypothetical protein
MQQVHNFLEKAVFSGMKKRIKWVHANNVLKAVLLFSTMLN